MVSGATEEQDANAEFEAQLSGWMQEAQTGNGDAYRKLLSAIEPRVRAIVRSRIRGDVAADDVVQNVLLSIHRGRATYRAERPFGPWMRAIVRNSIIDHFREQKRRGDRESLLPVDEFPDVQAESGADSEGLPPELRSALDGLPAAQKEAVTLVQIEGLSVAEAALRAGVSPGALKVRAHRGYRAMRAALEGARQDGAWRSSQPRGQAADADDGSSK